VFLLPSLALGACVTPSKSLGAGENSGTEGDDSTADSGEAPTTSPGTDTDDPPTTDEWCAALLDETSCHEAPEMEVPGVGPQFCRWIELHTLTIDADADACDIAGPESKCLTFDVNPEEGCGPVPCSIGQLDMSTAIARAVDDDRFEVWGLNDVFCGGGSPVGDWISAADPSLAQCQMTCGFDNACGIPLVEYIGIRSGSSKDAPVDDCGVVTPDDPLIDWQSAHACALQHAMAGDGFRLVADIQGIDSIPQEGFMGLQGESYATSRFSADTGGIDFDTLSEQPGAGLQAIDGCEIAVGNLCLEVTSPGEVVQLCPA